MARRARRGRALARGGCHDEAGAELAALTELDIGDLLRGRARRAVSRLDDEDDEDEDEDEGVALTKMALTASGVDDNDGGGGIGGCFRRS